MAFLKRQRPNISLWRQGIQSNPETLNPTLDFEPDTTLELTKSAAAGMSNISLWRQGIQSNPETLNPTLDFEPDTTIELTKSAAAGMWSYPTNQEHCCIYRVPHRLRRVKPEAYTPQLVLIGPLHHYLKSQPLESRGKIINTELMGYLNMEEHKKIYLGEFAKRSKDKNTIDGFRRTIKENIEKIRASYSETTTWIKSPDFVEMILLDSVFILEHLLRFCGGYPNNERPRTHKAKDDPNACGGPRLEKTGDLVVDDPCLLVTVKEDLMLLENQLPYFILEKLFDPIVPQLCPGKTLLKLILGYFGFSDEIIGVNSRFSHFTDLLRRVRVDTLGIPKPSNTIFRCLADLFRCAPKERCGLKKSPQETDIETHGSTESPKEIKHMYNAEKLYSAGVKFMGVENKDELSINVGFENGCLQIPRLWVRDEMELILRNIMALEQCHYPSNAYVCNFVLFLDFLIDGVKDVDLLIEEGVLHNWLGEQKLVAEMVNKLGSGIIQDQTCYAHIAAKVNAYYKNPFNRTRAVLGRMYFSNLWRGTATIAAILLLVMTLIQTVASVIQVMQK